VRAVKKSKPKSKSKPKEARKGAGPRRVAKLKEARVIDGTPVGNDRSQMKSAAAELSWAEFDRLVQQMAKAAAKFKPDAVVGVVHGGVFVGGALATAMKRDFYPVRISRRSRDRGLRGTPALSGVMPKELKGRRVLIVDDIASSGDTLELASAHAKGVGAAAVATAALVCRPDGFKPHFHALKEDTFFVFPWDYASVAEEQRFEL
jgi:hypoxanthine phosphoribosyltransferase